MAELRLATAVTLFFAATIVAFRYNLQVFCYILSHGVTVGRCSRKLMRATDGEDDRSFTTASWKPWGAVS